MSVWDGLPPAGPWQARDVSRVCLGNKKNPGEST